MHVDAILDDESILGISSRHVFLEHNEPVTIPIVSPLTELPVRRTTVGLALTLCPLA